MFDFFKSITNFFTTIFNLIVQNSTGFFIGLGLALLLVLILSFTAFKGNSFGWFLYIPILLILSFGSAAIQNQFWPADSQSTNYYVSAEELEEDLDKHINDGWDNSNGGFTFDQITAVQDDEDAPLYPDQVINMDVIDYGNYIVFTYDQDGTYYNALFYKSSQGLIYDGLLTYTASFKITNYIFYFKYNIDTFKWHKESNYPKYTYYTPESVLFDLDHDNMVSISRQSPEFLKDEHVIGNLSNKTKAYNHAMFQATLLSANNVTDHFIKFNEVELVQTSTDARTTINNFYNHLYNSIKGFSYNTTNSVNVGSLMTVPVPENLRVNYPVGESFKAQYPDIEYYNVYNCDIAVNLTFKDGGDIKSNEKNKEYVEDTGLENDDFEKSEITSILSVSFNDTANSDLSNLNFAATPITIEFTTADKTQNKTLEIKSLTQLNSINKVILSKNVTYNYTIKSDAVIFEEFQGTFILTGNSYNTSFDYYYQNNYILASVGLNPVSTVDTSLIDLSANPVKIILSNDNHTYQFNFTDNSMLNKSLTQVVELGEYTYTILSDQLIFNDTGKLTITTTDKNLLFNYGLNTEETNDEIFILLSEVEESLNVDNIIEIQFQNFGDFNYEGDSYVMNKLEFKLYDSEDRLLINGDCFEFINTGFNVSKNIGALNGVYKAQIGVQYILNEKTINIFSDILEVAIDNDGVILRAELFQQQDPIRQ